ncbi:MAG: VOC family protein [Myxococcales bacterium]|nr:VOC family protein [Myxococcales bacterium]
MDHIGIPISDASATRAFYTACLLPLGWRLRGFQEGRYTGFDKPGNPVLYFVVSQVGGSVHLAFRAEDVSAVHGFHQAALECGGIDHGGPGPRPDYGPTYYAAFVLDPDGHNVEAVFGGAGPARVGAVSGG